MTAQANENRYCQKIILASLRTMVGKETLSILFIVIIVVSWVVVAATLQVIELANRQDLLPF